MSINPRIDIQHIIDGRMAERPNLEDAWFGFGTKDLEIADKDACRAYGALYR